MEFGDRRYVRTLEMFKKELVAIKDMDEAETAKYLAEYELLDANEEKRLSKADLERAKAILELKTIRSPLSGVVVERLLTSGEFTKQAPILRLAQIDPLRVEVIVPVALFGRIKVGQSAEVYPEAPVGGTWAAKVTVVDRVIDAVGQGQSAPVLYAPAVASSSSTRSALVLFLLRSSQRPIIRIFPWNAAFLQNSSRVFSDR